MVSLEHLCVQYNEQFIKHFFVLFLDEDDRKKLRTTSSTMKSLIPRAMIIHKFSLYQAHCSYWLSSTGRVHSGNEAYSEAVIHLYKPFSEVESKLQSDVVSIIGKDGCGCAGLKKNGEVVTWGLKFAGGDF